MPWFKVDDGFFSHPKVASIPRTMRPAAAGAWLLAGTWSAKHLTDGVIPSYVPEELGATVNESGEMVDITATVIDRTPPRAARTTPAAEQEPVDAEVVDETTGVVEEERPAWGDRWEPAPWEDAIADALSSGDDAIARLRHVYRDASQRGVLQQRMSNGQTLADTLTALGKRLEQDQAAEQHEDGAA